VVAMLIFELQAGILKGAGRVRRKDLTYVDAVDDDSSLTIFFYYWFWIGMCKPLSRCVF